VDALKDTVRGSEGWVLDEDGPMSDADKARVRKRYPIYVKAVFGSALALLLIGAKPAEPASATSMRRLSEAQYAQSIEDIFGPGITIPGRFEPRLRDEGLLAIGDSKVAVTPSGFEQYDLRAREIASQVLSEKRRAAALSCVSQARDPFDESCARQFFSKYGRLLLRRPLEQTELAGLLLVARNGAARSKSFHKGLEAGLARLLVSPYFIFRVENARPERGGDFQLDDHSFAARLSFLLWDAPPDADLLDAAAAGSLGTAEGLERQVSRMMASPKFEKGVRAFFSDMFGYDQFSGLTKEQAIYKKFVSQLAKDAEEQSLRTIVQHLVRDRGDYRDLFTTRHTFMNRGLAAVYRVPIEAEAFDGWAPYVFQPEDQRQGLLSLAGFLMLDPTHEGRSSPTNRGKFVRELLMCQKVPAPPANVDFAVVQDTTNPRFKTARQRLTAHQNNPVCAGCHAITDPVGLAMENFDAIGQFRTHENGAEIDASGVFAGKPFRNLLQLQSIIRDDPGLPSCLIRRVYEYGVGQAAPDSLEPLLADFSKRFAEEGYRLPSLMRTIATSDAFRKLRPPTLEKIAARQNWSSSWR
jgi:hypothetical protein